MSSPVTREEMQDSVDRASAQSLDVIDAVRLHFDQRLKDSERVLTWRMIAANGVASSLVVLVGKFAGAGEPVGQAVAAVARLVS